MSIQIPENHQQCSVCCQPFFSRHTVIDFTLTSDGGVEGKIVPTEKVQGYQDVMQGGLITTLHDSAMTHCLFAQNIHAMTAQLNVRFLKPIPLNSVVWVKAHCLNSKQRMHTLQSDIYVNGVCHSRAEAKFMQSFGAK